MCNGVPYRDFNDDDETYDDDDDLLKKSSQRCKYRALESPYFEVDAGRPLSLLEVEALTKINQITVKSLSKHRSEINKSRKLRHLMKSYIDTSSIIIEFYRSLEKRLTDERKQTITLVENIVSSLKMKDYNNTEADVAKFMNFKTSLTGELAKKLYMVWLAQLSLLKELRVIKAELEAERRRFKKRKTIWKWIWRSVASVSALCLAWLLSMVVPVAATAAVPLALCAVAIIDYAFESWADSFETKINEQIENVQANITANGSPVEIYEMQDVQNKVKVVREKVGLVLRLSESGNRLKVASDENVRREMIKDIEDALEALTISFDFFNIKVNRLIENLDDSTLAIEQDYMQG